MRTTLASVFLFFGFSLTFVVAHPSPIEDLSERGVVLSAQYATESEANGRYVLQNNLWGSGAKGGSQSTRAILTNGDIVAWRTTYSWTGDPNVVASYANLDLRVGLSKQLSAISSIPTTWKWKYSSASSDLSADVSYDLWLSKIPGTGGFSSTTSYEIMIWLSVRGVPHPAGSQIGTVTIGGTTWKLWKGTVSNWIVFSFVPPTELTSFSQDLKPFLTYLTSHQGVSPTEYLVGAQGGTEAFAGSATLITSAYVLAIN